MIRSLVEVLAEVPDWRKVSGRRYELVGILTFVFLALLSGQNSIRQIAAWGRAQRWALSRKLGFKAGRMPAYSTIRRVMTKIDPTTLEGAMREWVREVESLLGEAEKPRGVSIDGKTVRGSSGEGPALQLLSAVVQETQWVLSQMAIPAGSSEQGIIPEFLKTLVLEGRIVALDALHTNRKEAQAFLDAGADYLLRVKKNQPKLRQDMVFWFQGEEWERKGDLPPVNRVVKGHGRLVKYRLESTTALNEYLDWPGVGQTFRLRQVTIYLKTGESTMEEFYGITSLSPEVALPQKLLDLWCQYWRIENDLHWVRDVVFEEDRLRTRTGALPHLLATLRNLVITALRVYGYQSIKESRTSFGANLDLALSFVGIS